MVHCVRYMALLTVLISERSGAGEGAVRKAGMEGVFGKRTEGRDEKWAEKRSERTNESNSIKKKKPTAVVVIYFPTL